MSWRERQGPATFRGVPFFVESSDGTGGRRLAEHEFPGAEIAPYVEDLGLQGRRFQVDGYVLGNEYERARDAVLAALERPGPGELVHPYHGTRRVSVGRFTVRQSRDSGGMARFSIEFVETSAEAPAPVEGAAAGAALSDAITVARASTEARFVTGYDGAAQLRDSVVGALQTATRTINGVVARCALPAQDLAAIRRQVEGLGGSITSLVSQPQALFSAVAGVVDSVVDGIRRAGGALVSQSAFWLDLFGFDAGTRPPDTTAQRAAERANFDLVQATVQRLALLAASSTIATETFRSWNEAVAARERITAALDTHVELSADDTVGPLSQLRAALVNAIPGDTSDLPRLVTVTPAATVSSLVLAHQIYGDVAMESDLLDRNLTRHPGFLAGGSPLEVLTRG